VHALQEEFLKAQAAAKPAARVTRISRKPAAESSAAAPAVAAAAVAAKQQATSHAPASQQQSVISERLDGVENSSGAAEQQHSPDSSAPAAVEQAMCPAIPGILFDVKERSVGSAAAAPPQPPTTAGAASFPAAVHRKQSKVGLVFPYNYLLQRVLQQGHATVCTASLLHELLAYL
jgi:hypothetical protein